MDASAENNNNINSNLVTPERNSNRFSVLAEEENIAALEAAIDEERDSERDNRPTAMEQPFSPLQAALNVFTAAFGSSENPEGAEDNLEEKILDRYEADLEAAYEESLQEIAEECYLHDNINVDSGATAHHIGGGR